MNADLGVELLQSTITTSLAIALVLLARKPLRLKFGALAAYAAWGVVPLAGIAVLLPAQASNSLLANAAQGTVGLVELGNFSLAGAVGSEPSAFLLPLWLAGALSALATFAHRQWRFNRDIRSTSGSPFARGSDHGPAVVGIVRPRIVLPTDFETRYSPEQQNLVIAHERLHLRRGDIPAQALATMLRCVFWFNPLIHFAATRFRFDQELACDADVLEAFPNSRRAYGEAMLKTQLADFGLPVGCHWQSSHPLKERIMMLSNPLPGAARRISGTALVFALIASGSYAAWAAQPVAPSASDKAAGTQENQVPTAASMPGVGSITNADILSPPDYPKGVSTDQSGHVLLELLVATDGTVKEARIVKSEPAGVFDEVTKQAALRWRFNTGRTTEGKKVEGWVRVPVEFAPHAPAASSKAG